MQHIASIYLEHSQFCITVFVLILRALFKTFEHFTKAVFRNVTTNFQVLSKLLKNVYAVTATLKKQI